ncbi:unnamed protein product [Rotaria sordida]|uniref:Uncharacterized protein n=1 Tax=Rotaria sordida TaxID=392033 RepID=A0A816DCA2_9BILA|nr:unnamed protein product [Rotaria sordida]CAF1633008.1 unnamed protein product [Rotaria sordida]
MLSIRRFKLGRRSFFRRFLSAIFSLTCIYSLLLCYEYLNKPYHLISAINNENIRCDFKPSTSEFILNYKTNSLIENQPDLTRVEPTIQRIRSLLEIIRSKEDKYQSLLETFDVFNMLNPNISLKPYSIESNIDEIKTLYNRFIKLMPDNKTIEIDQTFIDYLRKISNYLLDGLRDKRTNKFEVECVRKPVFVLACDQDYFDGLQGAIHTLDTYWSDHRIIFYDLGISNEQEILLRMKCAQCTIIKFPFSSIEKFARHIGDLTTYGFKPFVIQDALRRYGTVIYADSSIRFNSNSFNPVVIDNYIRGFAARELPGHYVSCYTHTDTFTWFNQSYTNFDNIYIAEAGFVVVTDTFLTRLIMKAWLTCALEPECLITFRSHTNCSRTSLNKHRYDQSAIVIILSYFFFQGNKGTWSDKKLNDPAPYDMFTSIQRSLGDIVRGSFEQYYLSRKKSS